jgi:hypothetical protein
MAKCFTTWTVLPHDPIEKHSENLWSVSGNMPSGNQRRMTIARRADGKLVIHNPIALDDAEMQEVEALGKPGYLVVPNAFHRQDSIIYKQRYPEAAVLCPETARKKVAQIVDVAGNMDEMPKDTDVEMFHLRGMKQREGGIRVRSQAGTSVVFNDALLNLEPGKGATGFFMAPTGTLSVPRFARWMLVKKGAELKEHLQELAGSSDLKQVVPGHGKVLAAGAVAALQQAAQRL